MVDETVWRVSAEAGVCWVACESCDVWWVKLCAGWKHGRCSINDLLSYDCQVMQQFSLSFEFNECFLHTLFVHSYSSPYGKQTDTHTHHATTQCCQDTPCLSTPTPPPTASRHTHTHHATTQCCQDTPCLSTPIAPPTASRHTHTHHATTQCCQDTPCLSTPIAPPTASRHMHTHTMQQHSVIRTHPVCPLL